MKNTPIVGEARRGADTLPFRLREHFLTAAEIGLYRALQQMLGDRYVIFSKVSLDELFSIVRPNENVHYFNKLFRKYVDFLLCSPESLKPQIVVELIRATPDGGIRGADQFMEDLFAGAGLPLVQIRAGEHIEVPELAELFRKAIAHVEPAKKPSAGSPQDSVPLCPVCGKMMVLRTQHSGKAQGRLYYGCIDNPSCPGRVAIK